MFEITIPLPEGVPRYQSPYGPKYRLQPSVAGATPKQLFALGLRSAGFGGVALGAVIFFASGIPRIQTDILAWVPGLYKFYEKKIPASDNPF